MVKPKTPTAKSRERGGAVQGTRAAGTQRAPIAHGDNVLVERLRKLCLALPEANERQSHGEPTWFAGKGKVFAMLDRHHHGAPHLSVWLPQRHGVQERLIDEDAERYFRPPYVGVKGWVGVVLDTRPDWKVVAALVRDAYAFVASRKLVALLKDDA